MRACWCLVVCLPALACSSREYHDGHADSGREGGPASTCFEEGCGAGLYCDDAIDRCGTVPSTSNDFCGGDSIECKAPTGEVGGEPVCGCDGAWHPTKRDAQLAGVDVSWSACTPPSPEYVQCGYKFCDRGRSFCLIVADECSTEPFCVPLPPACGGGDPCACIDAQQLCSDYDYSGLTSPSGCDMSTAGDLKLTCIA